MITETRKTIFECDRCERQMESSTLPKDGTYRTWASLRWEQDAGFGLHGCAWAPRKRDSIHLCSVCADAVMEFIETKPADEG